MPLLPEAKNCDVSVKKNFRKISSVLGYTGNPIHASLILTNTGSGDQLTLYKVCTEAAGLSVLRVTGLQTDDTALTGTLRGAYIDVSNGSTAATGTIRGMELKARTEAPGDTGNDVNVLEGLSISVDSKGHSVTTMRAAEFILDGSTGGTIDEAVGLRIANNLQANKATNSYALQIYSDSFGYTYGIDLSAGIYNTACINLSTTPVITANGTQVIKFDDTNQNMLLGSNTFDNDEGMRNIGIGYQAGYNNDTTGAVGDNNVYIGYQSGYGNTEGSNNTGNTNVGLGYVTLFYNTTGHHDVAVGSVTLYKNTTGRYNTGVGNSSLYSNTSGDGNVGVGYHSIYTNSTSDNNIGIGNSALNLVTSGLNTAIGGNAGRSSTSATRNLFLGFNVAYYNQTGDNNVIIGAFAAFSSSGNSFSNNVFIGSDSGRLVETGSSDNVFLGYKSGYNQTTLSDRLIIDNQDRESAAAEITDCLIYGVFNNTVASQTLRINAELTLWGDLVTDRWLESDTNIFLGVDVAGSDNLTTGGIWNVGIGNKVLEDITAGGADTMIGYQAGLNITDGNNNTGVGYNTLYTTTTGDGNTAVGYSAGSSGNGDDSVFLGRYAGYYETGSNKLFIDNTARASEADGRIKALIYGVFDAAIANQSLRVNAALLATDLTLDKASSGGIKVDVTTPTFGWRDLLGEPTTKNTGATKPSYEAYNGAIDGFRYSDGDEEQHEYHIPHDYVLGTDIYLHIHWSQISATNTGGTIDFKYSAVYSKGHNQAAFTSTPITDTITSADAGSTQYQHHITEQIMSGASATAALFDRDDIEPDGVILLTLEMDANNLTDSSAVTDPFIHFVDIHYQSTNIATKQKAPDFYA